MLTELPAEVCPPESVHRSAPIRSCQVPAMCVCGCRDCEVRHMASGWVAVNSCSSSELHHPSGWAELISQFDVRWQQAEPVLLCSLTLRLYMCCLQVRVRQQGVVCSLTAYLCGRQLPRRLQSNVETAAIHKLLPACRSTSDSSKQDLCTALQPACRSISGSEDQVVASQPVFTGLSQSASVMLKRAWRLQPLKGCAACLQVHIRQQGAICRRVWSVHHHLHHDRIQRQAQ